MKLNVQPLSGSKAVKINFPVGITAIGSYVPQKELSNSDFTNVHLSPQEEAFFNTDPGFKTNKRRVSTGETAKEMAVKAAKDAIKRSGIDPMEIDLVLSTSCTKDLLRLSPPIANYIQTAIGAHNAMSFVIDGGFNGWLPSVTTAIAYIASKIYNKVLVVTGETIVESMNTSTSESLFMGDGAGAFILEKTDSESGIMSFHHMAKEGTQAAGVHVVPGYGRYDSQEIQIKPYLYVAEGSFERDIPYLEHYIPMSIKESLKALNLKPTDINLFVFGQQYMALNHTWAVNLGVDYNKVHDTIAKYACIKNASIPVSLVDAMDCGKLKKGDLVAFGDQGANWSISSMVIKWLI